jgi:prepilin-type N-terminal cleavage/methylation domain-containing protein/prepilin-type processing-associated H-X9-DG protein
MKRVPSTDSRKAFTLLELMLVVFIVAILAALLLPVLSKAKGRGKQIECLSQLRQVGLAAQQFAHDHNGRFPFQVSVKDGGTLELVQAASGLGGDVQYAFRHFQVLSNDLDNPKLLACPADKRITTNAVNFASLRNEHISYFIAVTADYSRPESLLAGDRNIIARGGNSGSILRLAADTEVAWTSECHEYKGNLLFAGGHVERTGKGGLQAAMQDPTGPVNAWIPTASSSGSASPSSSGGSVASAAGGAGATGGSKGGRSSGGPGASGFSALQNFFQSPPSGGSATPAPTPPTPTKTVDTVVTEPPVAVDHPSSAFPDPPPKSPTNQIATPASPITRAPAAEPATAWIPEPPPGMLAIFVEPERCWWCWVLFLIVCVAAAVTLGVLIQRRQQRRLRAASTADRPSAS